MLSGPSSAAGHYFFPLRLTLGKANSVRIIVPIAMHMEPFLHPAARRKQMLALAIHFRGSHWNEVARDLDIVLEHRQRRHAHHCGAYRQAQGVTQ